MFIVIWKRPWCLERLRTGGEGDDRGWNGWMASSTWWTWVWVDSSSGRWTVRPGMLWFMGSQRVRHDWMTELNWTDCYLIVLKSESKLICFIIIDNPMFAFCDIFRARVNVQFIFNSVVVKDGKDAVDALQICVEPNGWGVSCCS